MYIYTYTVCTKYTIIMQLSKAIHLALYSRPCISIAIIMVMHYVAPFRILLGEQAFGLHNGIYFHSPPLPTY